ncbi:substrate-binding domain-containing protein [Paenibacillus sp. BK720]|uniref:LacI family DNA-binding transcriptional regulator n=1 Tax=Paenibacillus sp. BK720 TaxID=2587092 RepID=UPI00141EB21B|nr:substrate-binding domain-containing protein [Paenibacillus sp. BK720]NIK70361.1 LacI family transcriptional regulator [Paenibacillus sp. BK720]
MIPTIRDVAREANVSIATVSRVLNGLTGYSDKTKQKVIKTIEDMGYHPNAIARYLNNRRTQTIGVMFPAVTNEFASAVLQGIEEFALERGYSVLVCNTEVDGNRTMKYLQVLRERQIDGIIFASEVLKNEYKQMLDTMRVPLVLVSSENEDAKVPFVKVDDRQASYDAVRYLIGKGHKDIAMIAGTAEDPIAGVPRLQGYKDALYDKGIPFRSSRVAYGDFHYDSGHAAMETLLAQDRGITAVFAASDEMAVGAMNAALRQGIRVPEDLSVMGYDNIRLSRMIYPALTTVGQPLLQLGRDAAGKVIAMIETGKTVPSLIVPHEIVERQTVKDLRT